MSRPRKYALYCDPLELHKELIIRKNTGVTNDKLGKMYQDIIKGIMSRPNFSGYFGDLREEMEFCAIHNLIKYTHNYNETYYNTNPNAAFTYCSRIVFQCFTMTITNMKKKKEQEDEIMEILSSESFQALLRNVVDFDFEGEK